MVNGVKGDSEVKETQTWHLLWCYCNDEMVMNTCISEGCFSGWCSQ